MTKVNEFADRLMLYVEKRPAWGLVKEMAEKEEECWNAYKP